MDRPNSDKPSPEHFPLGSAQSRAAARVELDRRQCTMQETTVMLWVNFPKTNAVMPIEEQAIDPSTVECYRAPDGSIIRVITIDWDKNGKRVTRFLNRKWADGRQYDGTLSVPSIEEVRRLPPASEQGTTVGCMAKGVPVPASWHIPDSVSVFARYVRVGADGKLHDAPHHRAQMRETGDAHVDRVAPPTSISEGKDAKEPEPVIAAPVGLTSAGRSGEAVQTPHASEEQPPSFLNRRPGEQKRVSGFVRRRRRRWGTPSQQP